MGKSFWQKDSLITHILFELGMPILIFSPVYLLMRHPLDWTLDVKNIRQLEYIVSFLLIKFAHISELCR